MKEFRSGASFQRRQVLGQLHLMLRADDQVDILQFSERLSAGLCIAAGDRQKGVGGGPPDLSDEVPAVGLCGVRDRTGVQDDKIGRLSELDKIVASSPQLIGEHRGFRLVEAAADRMERSLWHKQKL